MRHALAPVLLLTLSLALSLCAFGQSESTWRHPSGKYDLTYPSSYEASVDPEDGSLSLSDSSAASTIIFYELAAGAPAGALPSMEEEMVKRFGADGYAILTDVREEFQGNPGFRLDMRKQEKGVTLRIGVRVFIREGTVYMFMTVCRDDAWDLQAAVFRKVLASLRFSAGAVSGGAETPGGTPAAAKPPEARPPSPPVTRTAQPGADSSLAFDLPALSPEPLVIDVPRGSYDGPRAFTVSVGSEPVSGGLTPLIKVDNGGAFAKKPVKVTIPVSVPAGSFAMAFFCSDSGALEGMPLLDEDSGHVTVLTCHFSSFFVGAVSESILPPSVRTGFEPGTDDWQMPNYGTFVTPGGHCTGQSISSMWYYYEKVQKGAPRLFGAYDNRGAGPGGVTGAKTPALWEDDAPALRLVSTVWRDLEWGSEQRNASLGLSDAGRDDLIFKAFTLSMKVTGEPQLVEIFGWDAKKSKWSGHALVVYRIDKSRLYVADPNHPGDKDRYIEYDRASGKFKPYFSGTDARKDGFGFTRICYVAKTALIPWARLGERWREFEESLGGQPQDNHKGIGKDYYPSYRLVMREPEGSTQLADLAVLEKDSVTVAAECPGREVRCAAYRNGNALPAGPIRLDPGYNVLGFLVEGAEQGSWRWLDFRYFKVYCRIGAEEEKKKDPNEAAAPDRPAETPEAGGDPFRRYYPQLHALTALKLQFHADAKLPEGRETECEFYVPCRSSEWNTVPITWDGSAFKAHYSETSYDCTYSYDVQGKLTLVGGSPHMDLAVEMRDGKDLYRTVLKDVLVIQLDAMLKGGYLRIFEIHPEDMRRSIRSLSFPGYEMTSPENLLGPRLEVEMYKTRTRSRN